MVRDAWRAGRSPAWLWALLLGVEWLMGRDQRERGGGGRGRARAEPPL